MTPRPIETRYKGYRFRSRLEARWAVFFETLGLPWEYEKEGFDLPVVGKYLPDFWLPLPSDNFWGVEGMWVEIKSQLLSEDERAKCAALAVWHSIVIAFQGPSPWPDSITVSIFYPDGGVYTAVPPRLRCADSYDPTGCSRRYCRASKGCMEFGLGHIWAQYFEQEEIPTPEFDFKKALLAARSARFEYGENG